MYYTKLIYSFLFLCITVYTCKAQFDCNTALKKGNELLKNGQYDESITILLNSLKKCHYSKHEKNQVYKILASNSYEIDDIERAIKYAGMLYLNNPKYKLDKNLDPSSFVALHNKIKIFPRHSFGFRAALAKVKFNIINIPKNDKPFKDYQYYTYTSSGNFGLTYEKHLNYSNTLNLEYLWNSISYRHEFGDGENVKVIYYETNNFTKLTLFLKTGYRRFKLVPELYGGLYYNMNSGGWAWAHIDYINSADTVNINVSNYYEIKNSRRNISGVLLGGRLSLNFIRFGFYFDTRYARDLRNLVNTDDRIIVHETSYDYYYKENDVIMSSWEFGFGIVYKTFYKTKSKY